MLQKELRIKNGVFYGIHKYINYIMTDDQNLKICYTYVRRNRNGGICDQLTATAPASAFIRENLVGFGWKLFLLGRSWLEGLSICNRIPFNELALAAMDGSQWGGVRGKDRAMARGSFLCLLQRKEPGCVLGEHKHVRVGWLGWKCWDLDDVNTVLEAMEENKKRRYEWF